MIRAFGVHHREEGVEAFGQERVREDRVRPAPDGSHSSAAQGVITLDPSMPP
jgi:hypothetical protein